MGAGGDMAIQAMENVVREHRHDLILIAEGATAAAGDGRYRMLGKMDGKPVTGYDHVRDLARDAQAVLAVGACPAFGGIPAAAPNPTQALSVTFVPTLRASRVQQNRPDVP
jgi:Ni,Fe-hydrogenase I small subunit